MKYEDVTLQSPLDSRRQNYRETERHSWAISLSFNLLPHSAQIPSTLQWNAMMASWTWVSQYAQLWSPGNSAYWWGYFSFWRREWNSRFLLEEVSRRFRSRGGGRGGVFWGIFGRGRRCRWGRRASSFAEDGLEFGFEEVGVLWGGIRVCRGGS